MMQHNIFKLANSTIYKGVNRSMTAAAVVLATILAACSIENDIPYPIREGNISAFQVKGQCDEQGNKSEQTAINKKEHIVELFVDETVDIANVQITKLSTTNDAVVYNGEEQWQTGTCFNAEHDINLTVKTYQDYYWKVGVKQVINRSIQIEGQIDNAVIDPVNRKAVVYVSKKYALNKLKVKKFKLAGEKGSVYPNPEAMEYYDFTSPQTFSVKHAYEDMSHEWTVWAYHKDGEPTSPDEPNTPPTTGESNGAQLPNGSLDEWHLNGKLYNPWAASGTSFWDTGNKGATTISKSNSVPTDDTATGIGQAALLESKWLVMKFAAGNLFTGEYVRTDGTNGVLNFGRPFTDKPKALEFYYKYESQNIDKVGDNSLSHLKGTPDHCHIYIALTDWDEPFEIRTLPSDRQIFSKDDAHVIAYAELDSGESVSQWTKKTLTLQYRDNRTPRHILVVASASKYGDFFTGGVGSKLWVDNFELVY